MIGLTALGFVSLAMGTFTDGRARRAWHAGALVCVVLTLAIFGALVGAQDRTCTALGGRWLVEEAACRNGWGGNGDNGDNS